MLGSLTGKIALVTGGSRGIGRAIAHKLAAAGCDVTVTYYNSHDQAESLCAEMRAMGRMPARSKETSEIPRAWRRFSPNFASTSTASTSW
jgi:NAD(P)-dependent dehydrogenase (short-subunit alcohol dehydrogenase family)